MRVWPLSDHAPQAQYLQARCLQAKGEDEKAFKAYQVLLEKYPKAINYEEALQRQYEIASREMMEAITRLKDGSTDRAQTRWSAVSAARSK